MNQVTYPPFVFNYPDNWSVTKEECNQQEELVTLENDGGASVTFLHYSGELQGGGSGVYMNKEEISKLLHHNLFRVLYRQQTIVHLVNLW